MRTAHLDREDVGDAHPAHYCKIHSTIPVTPAMEAKSTTHVWEVEDEKGDIQN